MAELKEIRAIKRWAEKELGGRLPSEFLSFVEEAVEEAFGEGEADFDGDPDAREEYVEIYRSKMEQCVGVVKLSNQANRAVEAAVYFASRPSVEKQAPTKRYQRCFEKRLHLVDFVLKRTLNLRSRKDDTIPAWYHEKFFPNVKGYVKGPTKRINWSVLASEWNEAHAHDLMQADTLKRDYYRAVCEADIQREYLHRQYERLMACHSELELSFNEVFEAPKDVNLHWWEKYREPTAEKTPAELHAEIADIRAVINQLDGTMILVTQHMAFRELFGESEEPPNGELDDVTDHSTSEKPKGGKGERE